MPQTTNTVPTMIALGGCESTPDAPQMRLDGNVLRAVVEALPHSVAILNDQLQIVLANASFRALLSTLPDKTLGSRRPSEALGCPDITDCDLDCGMTQFCHHCQAAQAVRRARRGETTVTECRIPCSPEHHPAALDLRVRATPLTGDSSHLVLFSVEDIAAERRRELLDRAFFHDVLNTAGAVLTLAEIAEELKPTELSELGFACRIRRIAERLTAELQGQRHLLDAECGRFSIPCISIRSGELLSQLVASSDETARQRDCRLRLAPECAERDFVSNRALLLRVAGEMITAALEVSPRGQDVEVGCRDLVDGVLLFVEAPRLLTPAEGAELFPPGLEPECDRRALRRYSAKLLAERHLRGHVEVVPVPPDATRITLRLPADRRNR